MLRLTRAGFTLLCAALVAMAFLISAPLRGAPRTVAALAPSTGEAASPTPTPLAGTVPCSIVAPGYTLSPPRSVFAWFECFADSASLQRVVGNTVASWVDPDAIVSATTGLTLTQLDARSVGIDFIPTGVPSVAVDAVFGAPSAATWPCPASSDPPSVIVSEAFDAFVASAVSHWPFVHCPIEKIIVLPAADPRQAVVVQITSNLNQAAVDAISNGLLSATRTASAQPTDTPTATSTSIPTAAAAPTLTPIPPVVTTTLVPPTAAPTSMPVTTTAPLSGGGAPLVLGTPTATAAASAATTRSHWNTLPLTVQVLEKSVIGSGILVVRVQTSPYAQVRITLEVMTRQAVAPRKGRHRTRTMRSVVLYQCKSSGATDARGQLTRLLRIRGKPGRIGQGMLVVQVRTAGGTATRTAWVTIQLPRHQATHRH